MPDQVPIFILFHWYPSGAAVTSSGFAERGFAPSVSCSFHLQAIKPSTAKMCLHAFTHALSSGGFVLSMGVLSVVFASAFPRCGGVSSSFPALVE